MKPKVILIGLDGATWELIKPWADEGKLPTFKKLMDEGIWGELESTMPPLTPPAWAAFLTGKNPGKTGIYDFFYLKDNFPPTVGITSGALIRENNLLTILSKNKVKIISINIPMTYPPYKIRGSLITGIETPDGRKFAYPDALYERLVQENYLPEPKIPYIPGKEENYLNNLRLRIKKRNNILLNFLEEDSFDLILFFFRETDLVSHTFWRYMDKNHPLHTNNNLFYGAILDIYKMADHLLKEVMERKSKNTLLIVMSDHGFGPSYYRVSLNNWLLKKGYISLKNNFRTIVKKMMNRFISPAKAWKLINKFRSEWLFKIKKELTQIGRKGFTSNVFLIYDDVDWERTGAYSIGSLGRHLPIFIKDRKSLTVEKIKKDILSINDFFNRKVVKGVIDTKEIYTKNSDKILPDLFVEFKAPFAGYVLSPPYISEDSSILINSPITQSGAHKNTGILIAFGPWVNDGKMNKSNIIDIAPTLLTLFGIKIPKDMDGKILPEIKKYVCARERNCKRCARASRKEDINKRRIGE